MPTMIAAARPTIVCPPGQPRTPEVRSSWASELDDSVTERERPALTPRPEVDERPCPRW